MVTLIRTTSENPDFINLVRELDADLAIRDGKDHSFYSRFNKIINIRLVVVAYDSGKPAGCGD
jgi:putative acetyltransferase